MNPFNQDEFGVIEFEDIPSLGAIGFDVHDVDYGILVKYLEFSKREAYEGRIDFGLHVLDYLEKYMYFFTCECKWESIRPLIQMYREHLIWLLRQNIMCEDDLVEIAKEHLTELFGETAKLKTVIMDPKNKPDLFIEVKGITYPVEFKLRKFDNRALEQLKRYVRHYNSYGGFAVAPELTTELPENIWFVKLSFSTFNKQKDKI